MGRIKKIVDIVVKKILCFLKTYYIDSVKDINERCRITCLVVLHVHIVIDSRIYLFRYYSPNVYIG